MQHNLNLTRQLVTEVNFVDCKIYARDTSLFCKRSNL